MYYCVLPSFYTLTLPIQVCFSWTPTIPVFPILHPFTWNYHTPWYEDISSFHVDRCTHNCPFLTMANWCVVFVFFWTVVDVLSNIDLHAIFLSWQLWTVAVWVIQPMAVLITLLEQHSDRMPPTVVTRATTWWETALALVKLQEIGLGVHLPVKVCY